MAKKILLIGSSYSALPILFYLKKQGFYVCVCGAYKDDVGHLYANKSFYIDYSDKEELLKLCKKEKFDYIVPSCNDYAYNSASYIASKLNFIGFDDYNITMLLHTKNRFRNFLVENNFPSPKVFNDLNDVVFPLLIKPVSQFSGRGIIKINLKEELSNLNLNKKIVIEEFIEGELYSHSAFIENQDIKIDFFVREFCFTYEYQVDGSYVDDLNLNIKNKNKIREEIRKVIKKLNLKDGLLHTQFLIKGNKIFLIETMRRCPGDLYGYLIEKSTNYNYIANYVNPFIGKKISNSFVYKRKYIIRHTISTNKDLNFKSIIFKIRDIEFFPLKESGEEIKKAPYDKIGIFFYKVANFEKLKEVFNLKSSYIIKEYDEKN